MKVIFKYLLVMFCVLLISSCGATKWTAEKDGISLHIIGDPALNQYQKNAHTLIACVYQLKDLTSFNQLIDEKGGLEKLLECNRFDPAVTYYKRLVVQPKEDLTESMNRIEETKYLGIVAGYYFLGKEHSVRSFPIQVSWLNNPKKLNLDLHMGPVGIQERKENQ